MKGTLLEQRSTWLYLFHSRHFLVTPYQALGHHDLQFLYFWLRSSIINVILPQERSSSSTSSSSVRFPETPKLVPIHTALLSLFAIGQ
jgi:hypothetical protein